MLFNNKWVSNEIKDEIFKNYLKTNENEHTTKLLGHSDSNPEMAVHILQTCLKKKKYPSNKQSYLTAKRTRKIKTNQTQSNRRKQILRK